MNGHAGPHVDNGSGDEASNDGNFMGMFGLSSKSIEQDTNWCFQDVNAAIAVAEYVSASVNGASETYSEAQFAARGQTSRHGKQASSGSKLATSVDNNRTNKDAEKTVLAILTRLPDIRCSRTLGANGQSPALEPNQSPLTIANCRLHPTMAICRSAGFRAGNGGHQPHLYARRRPCYHDIGRHIPKAKRLISGS